MSGQPDTPLKFGLTGCGNIASTHIEEYEKYDDVQFVGFCDIEREKAASARSLAEDVGVTGTSTSLYENHSEMLQTEDLDGVIISTPHSYHGDHVITALQHDVNVLVEKPLAGATTEVDRINRELRRSDAGVLVNYQKRLLPRYQIAKEYIEEGNLGTLCNINAYRARDTWSSTFDTWRNDPDVACGGKLLDLGNHLIDATLWLVDSRPDEVLAVCDNKGANVEMFSSVSASLDDGTTASFNISAKSPVSKERIEIVGMEGAVTVDKSGVTLYSDNEVLEYVDTSEKPPEETPDDQFRRAILEGDFPEDLDGYKRSVELAERAYDDNKLTTIQQ